MKTSKMDGSSDSRSNQPESILARHRYWVWPFVILYVASLPYAIVIFDFLTDVFTLPVIKGVPALLLIVAALGYLLTCYRRKQVYHLRTLVVPVAIVLCGVFALESNPIKYLHVPEYMLLTCMIYLGLSRRGSKIQTLVISASLASLLGVVDEIHQGLHPARYFGWKDMLINTAGGVIGALFLNAIGRRDTSSARPRWILFHEFLWPSGLLLASLLIGIFTVFSLFQVVANASFVPTYSFSLFLLNLIMVALSLLTVIKSHSLLADDYEYETLLFWPTVILMLMHGVAAYAYSNGGHFL